MEIRTTSVTFPRSRGSGPRTASDAIVFPRDVERATAGLTSYMAGFRGADHHLGWLTVNVDTTINTNVVELDVTYGLRDWSGTWDDDYAGTVDVAVFADLVPQSAPPRRDDLMITGMEFNQATQSFRSADHLDGPNVRPDNDTPLLAGKATGVRVYVDYNRDSGLPEITDLSGELVVETATGATFSLSPLATILPQRDTETDRGEVGDTLNFSIPGFWSRNELRLRCHVFDAADPDQRSSIVSRTVRFRNVTPLSIYGVGVHYTGQGMDLAAPSQADTMATFDFVRKTYPTSDVLTAGYSEIEFDTDMTANISDGCGDGFGELLDQLRDMRGDSDDIYYAVLPNGVNTGSVGGCGGGGVGAGFIGGGSTAAQEIGHAFDRDHAPCDNSSRCGDPGNQDGNYPDYDTFVSDSIGEFGFDPSQNEVHDPVDTFDFMGYSSPNWVSPYTYEGMLSQFDTVGGSSMAALMARAPLLLAPLDASGDATIDADAVDVDTILNDVRAGAATMRTTTAGTDVDTVAAAPVADNPATGGGDDAVTAAASAASTGFVLNDAVLSPVDPSALLPALKVKPGWRAEWRPIALEHLDLRVTIDRNRTVTRDPSFHYPHVERAPHGDPSAFVVELLDADGDVVSCQQLHRDCHHCETGCWPRQFRQTIPFPDEPAMLRICEDDDVIYEEAIPKPPTVEITEVDDGDGPVTLHWTAESPTLPDPEPGNGDDGNGNGDGGHGSNDGDDGNDGSDGNGDGPGQPDVDANRDDVRETGDTAEGDDASPTEGDPEDGDDGLTYLVHWRDRDGAWRGVAPRTTATSIEIPARLFRGRDSCPARVLATSGIATGVAEYEIEGRPRDDDDITVVIDYAPDIGALALVRATAVDATGRTLPNPAFRWYDDSGAELVRGPVLDRRQLSTGDHLVRAVPLNVGAGHADATAAVSALDTQTVEAPTIDDCGPDDRHSAGPRRGTDRPADGDFDDGTHGHPHHDDSAAGRNDAAADRDESRPNTADDTDTTNGN